MILGFKSFFQGYLLIWKSRTLKVYALIPFLVSLLFFVGGVNWGWGLVATVVAGWLPAVVGFWTGLLSAVVSFFSFLIFALLLGIVSMLVANIGLAPFNSLLAERALQELGVLQGRQESYSQALREALRMLWVSLGKACLFLLVAIVLFALSFVPFLAIASWFFGCLLLAFDVTDYSFEALRMGFRQRFFFFRQNLGAFAGLALAIGLTFFIPGANLFLLPGAVAGGAVLMSKIGGRN